jgi:two-component system response regulator (stage 0 sporulation protein F)
LIVEDDEDIRRNLVRVLHFEGYRTLEAANGKIAIDLLTQMQPADWPSCILLDLMMPVMDGITFLGVLQREHPEWAKIPIILNTAKGGVKVPSDELPGAIARLKKPVDLDHLYEMIARYALPG